MNSEVIKEVNKLECTRLEPNMLKNLPINPS